MYLNNKKISFLDKIYDNDNYKELSEYEDEIKYILQIINHLNFKILNLLKYELLQINFINSQIKFLEKKEKCFKLPQLILNYLNINSHNEIDINADTNEKYKRLNILKIKEI